MDIAKIRKEFSIFVIDCDFSSGQGLVAIIRSSGYAETSYFPTVEAALAVARRSPPHVVLFDQERMDNEIESALLGFQELSSEILNILMMSPKQALAATRFVGRGLAFDSIARPLVSSLQLIQTIDRAVSRLYYQFESEQVREWAMRLEAGWKTELSEKARSARSDANVKSHVGPSQISGPGVEEHLVQMSEYIARISMSTEMDRTVALFMEHLSRAVHDTPILYFKYVPSHMSLLISRAVWLPIEKFRGVGIDLKREAPSLSLDLVHRDPARLDALSELMTRVFRVEKFTAFSHSDESGLHGVFVILDTVEGGSGAGLLQCYKGVFELAYKRNLILKEKHALDATDPITGLWNRRRFSRHLEEEVSRARRLTMPVSLISLEIDNFRELHKRLGAQQFDALLKTIASILKTTARVNDVIARTGTAEFSLLLPHTGHMGAAVKAERCRRVLESARIPLLQSLGLGPVTVSCGVSEYPSFSSDADGLMQSADQALAQVRESGGNKVCLSIPNAGFKPDFTCQETAAMRLPPLLDLEGG